MHMEKKKEDHIHRLHAVWFAAGSTLVMAACLQRAAVVPLAEQWRVWVFLALNILLLAILFTSNSKPPKTSDIHEQRHSEVLPPYRNRKRSQHFGTEVVRNKTYEMKKGREQWRESNILNNGEGKGTTADQLSKEELNERVEAFIAMFRQQLVSDKAN